MSCTKYKILSIAANYVGYREKNHESADLESFKADAGDGNFQKFQPLANAGNGDQWCQYFVDGVAVEATGSIAAAKELLCQDNSKKYMTGYTPEGASFFKAAGRWFTEPEVGDVIYFYSKSMGRICHTGWVEGVDKKNKTVYTIEGNTNTDENFTTNGGCVARHNYSYAKVGAPNRVAGFGRPRYTEAEPEKETELKGMHLQIGGTEMICKVETIRKGSEGTAVLLLQEILKARTHMVDGKLVPYYSGPLDRSFGTGTEKAVIDYQAERIADGAQIGGDDGKPDGVVGKDTWYDLLGLPVVQA